MDIMSFLIGLLVGVVGWPIAWTLICLLWPEGAQPDH